MTRTLSQIAELAGAELHLYDKKDVEIDEILYDSRRLRSVEKTLFIAIRGDRNNGHDYLQILFDTGIRNFLVEKIPENLARKANFLVNKNSLRAFQNMAQAIRENSSAKIIGITGSNGKTIVKEWLSQLLKSEFQITKNPKSYNSQVGVPLSVWNLKEEDDFGIFEAGISRPNEMAKLEKILQPDIGIFTSLGTAHQENFESFKQKWKEKFQLFKNCKRLVFRKEQSWVNDFFDESQFSFEAISWSLEDETATVFIQKKSANYHFQWDEKSFDFILPQTDFANEENALHAAVTSAVSGLSPEKLKEKSPKLQPVSMRLEMKAGRLNTLLINDSYNSDLESLKIGLEYFLQQAQNRPKTLVLSDILQSGISVKNLYKKIAEILKSYDLKSVISIGNEIQTLSEFYHIQNHFADTELFLKNVNFEDFQNQAILLKGARDFQFEKIEKRLEEKTHETVLEVHLSRIVDNLNYYRSQLKSGVKTMAMVKAFSYGSGSYEIASLLQFHKVDYLAVAYADEGVALRQAGIAMPILVLNTEISAIEEMMEYRLEPEVYSFKVLNALLEKVKISTSEEKFPIHLKLETGMHRLGFEEDKLDKLIEILQNQNVLEVRTAFSHLVASEDGYQDDFTQRQISLFEKMSEKLQQKLPPFDRHILNSSGISRFKKAQFEMVRLGIGLYGISSNKSDRNFLKSVSNLKATISQIKKIKKGDSVSYGRSFIAKNPMKIATISIGYADGFRRSLGEGIGEVFIKGKHHKTVGKICMDMMMVDITNSELNEGDEVEIFGLNISIYELADKMQTIPYEVLTGISERVKRVYFME